VGLYLEND